MSQERRVSEGSPDWELLINLSLRVDAYEKTDCYTAHNLCSLAYVVTSCLRYK